MSYKIIRQQARGTAMQTTETRKIRTDLIPEELERLAKFGAIEFKSARPAWDPGTAKFIPSREQH